MSAPDQWSFPPDARRAQALDAAMHRALADSLEHVHQQAGHALNADEHAVAALIQSLRAGTRYPSTMFAHYYRVVDALLDEDEAIARHHYSRLLAHSPVTTGAWHRPMALDDAPGVVEYRYCMEPGLGDSLSFCSPSPATMAEFTETCTAAMTLLQDVVPELAGEVRALAREVVGVMGAPGDRGYFQGGSHFQLWGALFLNAQRFRTRVEMAEVIAHECGHLLLFGFCTEAPLVFNDDNELYPSPLRQDPRPMDGIYHATFVSARMHWIMQQLLDSGHLDAGEREAARRAMEEDRHNFEAGDAVVRAHGQLSEHGAALLANARSYMEQSAR